MYEEVETKRWTPSRETTHHRCVNSDESFVSPNESMAVKSFNRPISGSLSRKHRMSNESTGSFGRTVKDVYASHPTPVYAYVPVPEYEKSLNENGFVRFVFRRKHKQRKASKSQRKIAGSQNGNPLAAYHRAQVSTLYINSKAPRSKMS